MRVTNGYHRLIGGLLAALATVSVAVDSAGLAARAASAGGGDKSRVQIPQPARGRFMRYAPPTPAMIKEIAQRGGGGDKRPFTLSGCRRRLYNRRNIRLANLLTR